MVHYSFFPAYKAINVSIIYKIEVSKGLIPLSINVVIGIWPVTTEKTPDSNAVCISLLNIIIRNITKGIENIATIKSPLLEGVLYAKNILIIRSAKNKKGYTQSIYVGKVCATVATLWPSVKLNFASAAAFTPNLYRITPTTKKTNVNIPTTEVDWRASKIFPFLPKGLGVNINYFPSFRNSNRTFCLHCLEISVHRLRKRNSNFHVIFFLNSDLSSLCKRRIFVSTERGILTALLFAIVILLFSYLV